MAIPVSAEHDFVSAVFTGTAHKQSFVSVGQGPDHPKGDEAKGVGSRWLGRDGFKGEESGHP